MSKTMQAYRLHAYGGPSTLHLDTIPIPAPSPTQILVKVSYTAVNPFDWKIREGYIADAMPLPLPYTLGIDIVGTVVASGAECERGLKEGERVMTFNEKLGAFAEYVVVEESILARVPDALSDEIAATLPIPALTAWEGLHKAGAPKQGSKILIHGASGVCGAFAVQFAKLAGCHVTGTASGKNKDFVLSLGADVFIDYKTQSFEDLVSDVDLILDFVLIGGLMETTSRSWKVLKKGGAMVSFADPSLMGEGSVPEGYKGFFVQTKPDAEALENIGKMMAEGRLKSKVAKVYPRGELVEALEVNKAGGTTGRLLVDFQKA